MMPSRRLALLLVFVTCLIGGAWAEPDHDPAAPHNIDEALAASNHAPAAHGAMTPVTAPTPHHEPAPTPSFAAALADFLETKAAEDAHQTPPPETASQPEPDAPETVSFEDAPPAVLSEHADPLAPHSTAPSPAAAESHTVTAAHAQPSQTAAHTTEPHGSNVGAQDHQVAAHAPAATDAHGAAIETTPDDPSHLIGTPLESLMRLGDSQARAGNNEGATTAYFQVLQAHAPEDIEVAALIGLSNAYKAMGERTRAVAILERLIKDHASAPEAPRVLLDAGRLHRALGADRLALSRFYAVLQATLRIPDPTWADTYRQLARTAQYEIAETHLRAGRYEEAERYFTRFSLLELAPSDRARGAYKVIEARSAAGNNEAVVSGVNEFIDQYPNDEHVPAALHCAATALRDLGRADDALGYTLQLLQGSNEQRKANPAVWAYWQRRTGNELANAFFQRGEFANAQQIYDSLASLDSTPAWQLPASYQSALCRERLGMTDEALTLYRDIVKRAAGESDPGLQEISRMAAWRITHVETIDRERADIRDLISSLPSESAATATTATASAP